ncbi:MAG: YraN family protein, partial [Planctomycetota bacterium]
MNDPDIYHLGAQGESQATQYLKDKGWDILERNLHVGGGEIDIIAQDGKSLVFVEVKTRQGDSHGQGAESITATKARRLARACNAFLQTYEGDYTACRCDVIAVQLAPAGEDRLEHFEDALDLEGA